MNRLPPMGFKLVLETIKLKILQMPERNYLTTSPAV